MMASLTKSEWVVSWICRIVAAVILAQTLFFKFTGAQESIYIFTKVGLEPWGRYGSGVAELIAVVATSDSPFRLGRRSARPWCHQWSARQSLNCARHCGQERWRTAIWAGRYRLRDQRRRRIFASATDSRCRPIA